MLQIDEYQCKKCKQLPRACTITVEHDTPYAVRPDNCIMNLSPEADWHFIPKVPLPKYQQQEITVVTEDQ